MRICASAETVGFSAVYFCTKITFGIILLTLFLECLKLRFLIKINRKPMTLILRAY